MKNKKAENSKLEIKNRKWKVEKKIKNGESRMQDMKQEVGDRRAVINKLDTWQIKIGKRKH